MPAPPAHKANRGRRRRMIPLKSEGRREAGSATKKSAWCGGTQVERGQVAQSVGVEPLAACRVASVSAFLGVARRTSCHATCGIPGTTNSAGVNVMVMVMVISLNSI